MVSFFIGYCQFSRKGISGCKVFHDDNDNARICINILCLFCLRIGLARPSPPRLRETLARLSARVSAIDDDRARRGGRAELCAS